MNVAVLLILTLVYLALMFVIAQRTEGNQRGDRWFRNQGLTYALSLGVYCTAWTFYGSFGRAATTGIDFLAIYVGPVLMMPLWWIIARKVIRIVQLQHITSLADFLAARYGKDQRVGAMVAVIALLSITPYIALQIKAISSSFIRVSDVSDRLGWIPGALTATVLCAFTIVYGTRFVGSRTPRRGMINVIAFESAIKLAALLIAGWAIVRSDRWQTTSWMESIRSEELRSMFTFESGADGFSWMIMVLVSGIAILILPRQFQVGVVENEKESHLKTAMWMFPIYLLLINLFVIPVAMIARGEFEAEALGDFLLIDLARELGSSWLPAVIYIGGFSAATSMIIVSAIALGGMLSTNLIVPRIIKPGVADVTAHRIIQIRRVSIVIVFILAYLYGWWLIDRTPLVSIGMASFIGIAQLAPAFFAALFWKDATKTGAISGILVGATVWATLLIVPGLLAGSLNIGDPLADHTYLLGAEWFNRMGLERIPGTALLSLLANGATVLVVSLVSSQTEVERQQAVLFADAMHIDKQRYDSTGMWRSSAPFPDIKSLLITFLGDRRTEEVLDRYARINNIDFASGERADPRVVSYAERLLTGAIGPASARIMLSHVVKDEEISIDEVVEVVAESRRVLLLNKALEQKSAELERATCELREANNQLKQYAELKNEFLYTVTHELRTPLTAIRSQAEMLLDDPEIPQEDRQFFLEQMVSDCERLTTLITNVLDLERYESGNFTPDFGRLELMHVLHSAIRSMDPLAKNRGVSLRLAGPETVHLDGDALRLEQVAVNLISNAIRFAPEHIGKVDIAVNVAAHLVVIDVCDNGPGIPSEERTRIFEKFYQASKKKGLRRNPEGSGLGLAICHNIAVLHGGRIYVTDTSDYSTCFRVELPLSHPQENENIA